ncbi:hypothetical protein DZS_02220 [Dickeya ananatis]
MSIFDDLLSISASEFGFIGQVREHENKKVLHIVAISNVSWNGDSKKFLRHVPAKQIAVHQPG